MTDTAAAEKTAPVQATDEKAKLSDAATAADPALLATLLQREHRSAFDYTPKSLDGALTIAEKMAESDLVPKDYRGKPANVFVAMQWGHELGLKPMQAVQNIAVINGRPGLWGDAMLALVRSSPLCEYVREEFDADGTAICRVRRRGDIEQARTFSVEDAKTAGLTGKDNTHKTYPGRMRQMRARSYALRDVFTDVLRGIPMAEELVDALPATDDKPAEIHKVQAPQSKSAGKNGAGGNGSAATNGGGGHSEPSAADTTPASEGMLKMIRTRLSNATLTEAECLKKFDLEQLAGITVAQANAILTWTAHPAD